MNVLFISCADMSVKNGGSICTKAYLDVFSKISTNLTLMLPYSGTYAWDFSEVKLVEVGERSFISKIFSVFGGSPHRFYPFLKQYLCSRNIKFDLVVFSGSILGYGIADYLQRKGIPFVCIHHNFESDFHRDNKTKASFYGKYLKKIRYSERVSLTKSLLNYTLSQNDLNKLCEYYMISNRRRLYNIGCFLPEDEIVKQNQAAVNKKKIVITGALCDIQTEDGILYYLSELHNILKKIIPDVVVYIAGRNPSLKLIKECDKETNIKLIPNPENIESIIEDALLFINPTRLGSGLKLRNMDPLKLGIPIIVHKVSSRGYEELLGKCVWAYDDVNEFEIELKKMIEKLPNRKTVQHLFDSHFSFEVGKNKVIESLKMFNRK